MPTMDVRVQGPEGLSTITIDADSTLDTLRSEIALTTGIGPAEQQLLIGFPPQPVGLQGTVSLTDLFGGSSGTRVLVRRTGPAAPAGGSSQGRRKPQQVRRIPTGQPAPHDQPTTAASADSSTSSARQGGEATQASIAAPAPDPSNKSRKRKQPAPAPEPDPLALTLAKEAASKKVSDSGRSVSSGGADGVPKIKARSPEQLALDHYMSSGSAIQSAARGGGKTGDFLSEHGMIEYRVAAVSASKYELSLTQGQGKTGATVLSATFKGVRKQVCEHVQYLPRDQLLAFVRALSSRGSSSRRGGASAAHLLTVNAMAARSPAILWSVVHAFDGDVTGGV